MDSGIVSAQTIDTTGITLPAKAIDGLVTIQTDEMKRAVVTVNQNVKIAGAAIRQVMQDLYDIKTGVLGSKRKGNWIAFLESGLLNISPKTARDLVAAYDNWIKKESETIPDYVFSNMTARTLAVVSSGTDEAKNLVLSRVRSGEKITEAEARRLVSTKKKTSPNEVTAKMNAADTEWDKYCENKIKEIQEDLSLTADVKSKKVDTIEKKQANMKKIASRLEKLSYDVKKLQKLVYSTVENGNKFQKNDDAFLSYYQRVLLEKGIDVVNVEEGVANLQQLNKATQLFSTIKE